MTDSNYRHVILVSDRSGSMAAIRVEAEGAINAFVKDLANGKGRTTVTLREFDTFHDEICHFASLDSAPHYTLVPRGATALNDAIGYAIVTAGEDLKAMAEENRPGNVTLVVITDGQENSSKEYTVDQVKAMITHQQDAYGWTVIYLSADPTAQQQAQGYGVPMASSAQFDTINITTTSGTTSGMANRSWNTGAAPSYTATERSGMSQTGAKNWQNTGSGA